MLKYIAALIMLAIAIIGYNFYLEEKEKEEAAKNQKNKPKVVDFKKDFNKIFFGSEKEPEEEKKPAKNNKEIKTLLTKKKVPGSRTLTNKDVERLNKKAQNDKKTITKEDIIKLKNRDPDAFEEKVEIKKEKKIKPKKKLSPLEKIIDSAKRSFSDNNDDDIEN